jgi:hypothetical protein
MKSCWILLFLIPGFLSAQSFHKTKHVFIITTDGFRWQEFFQGADSVLLFQPGVARETADQYWSTHPDMRRQKLMPFCWTRIARQGQLFGNRNFGNQVNVRNAFKISYPGYNEILTGYSDPVLIPNIPIRNRNRNVLGICNARNEYQGKVAAFTTWQLFPFILNEHRDPVVLNPACHDDLDKTRSPDENTFCHAMTYLAQSSPDLVFISFGETDEWAHKGNYGQYLQSAHRVDEMIGKLWDYVQSNPYYRDETTFIITSDHGRGQGKRWHTHGPFSKGSGDVWMAVIGPEVAPLGEARIPDNHYQTEIAPTIARLLNFPLPDRGMQKPALLSVFFPGRDQRGEHPAIVRK